MGEHQEALPEEPAEVGAIEENRRAEQVTRHGSEAVRVALLVTGLGSP
jgi:hypothetical protein